MGQQKKNKAKDEKRKLRRIQEEREKKARLDAALAVLQQCQAPQQQLSLLQSAAHLGQRTTRKQIMERTEALREAGAHHLVPERRKKHDSMTRHEEEEGNLEEEFFSAEEISAPSPVRSGETHERRPVGSGNRGSEACQAPKGSNSKQEKRKRKKERAERKREKKRRKTESMSMGEAAPSGTQAGNFVQDDDKGNGAERSRDVAAEPLSCVEIEEGKEGEKEECGGSAEGETPDGSMDISSSGRAKGDMHVHQEDEGTTGDDAGQKREAESLTEETVSSATLKQAASPRAGSTSASDVQTTTSHERSRPKFWVQVQRPDHISLQREGLPVVMMESEIMEAVQGNAVVVICGETGSGKTTQVPQFLYEAGFGSPLPGGVRGAIGVTQPRRVAALATARRLAEELDSHLGKEVGFQVRHDTQIGRDSAIKVMTDGILLREVQTDFLLRHYSVVIIDEAHERSVNTDILLGLLSRIIPLRQRLYDEHVSQEDLNCRDWEREGHAFCPSAPVLPLKLIVMSATLRVEDFTANGRLFPSPPPVVSVPARQHPVTLHFSRRTELRDYVAAAERKVLAIHRRLPAGGVLVFLTGQREVEELCRRLRRQGRRGRGGGGGRRENVPDRKTNAQAVEGRAGVLTEVRGKHSEDGLDIEVLEQAGKCEEEEGWREGDADLGNEEGLLGRLGSRKVPGDTKGSLSDSEDDDVLTHSEDEEEEDEEEEWETWGVLGGSEILKGAGEGHPWAGLPSLEEVAAGLSERQDHKTEAEINKKASSEVPSAPGGTDASTSQGFHGDTANQSDAPSSHASSVAGSSSDPRTAESGGPRNLHVLPLYAMLPPSAQLRVFKAAPEDSRMVVVATNVAETSITIPGIRYVVDGGRVKVKRTSGTSGAATFTVEWISQASADQRAGRAGRTGPGHCYRLYSSAVFADTFEKFSAPEIWRSPIDGVVLHMKALSIDKVVNFPFPTPPEKQVLAAAERALKALSALHKETGVITALGRAMATLPVGPRHARMLLEAVKSCLAAKDSKRKAKESTSALKDARGTGDISSQKSRALLLPFACAVAAAMSVENPFLHATIPKSEEQGKQSAVPGAERKAKGGRKQEEADSKEPQKAAEHRSKFQHPQSDALCVALALRAYEGHARVEKRDMSRSNDGPPAGLVFSQPSAALASAFCAASRLSEQRMREACLLRQQLMRVLFGCQRALQSFLGECVESELRDLLAEGEGCWQEGSQHLSPANEMTLLKAICAGWADRVARKLAPGEQLSTATSVDGTAELSAVKRKASSRRGGRYETLSVAVEVLLSPSSCVRKAAPEMVAFSEIVFLEEKPERPYLTGITAVKKEWLKDVAPSLCTFSRPLPEPAPFYSLSHDAIMCWVEPTFGPKLWELPLSSTVMAEGKLCCAVFASALLGGKVVKALECLEGSLCASPSLLLKVEGRHQKRASDLVSALYGDGSQNGVVDSLRTLCLRWKAHKNFLQIELLAWVKSEAKESFLALWPSILESAMDQISKIK